MTPEEMKLELDKKNLRRIYGEGADDLQIQTALITCPWHPKYDGVDYSDGECIPCWCAYFFGTFYIAEMLAVDEFRGRVVSKAIMSIINDGLGVRMK